MRYNWSTTRQKPKPSQVLHSGSRRRTWQGFSDILFAKSISVRLHESGQVFLQRTNDIKNIGELLPERQVKFKRLNKLFPAWVLAWNEGFKIAKEELDEDACSIGCVRCSRFVICKTYTWKKVKRNEARWKCVRFRYHECFSTLSFTHSAMFLKYIINLGMGKLEVYKHLML